MRKVVFTHKLIVKTGDNSKNHLHASIHWYHSPIRTGCRNKNGSHDPFAYHHHLYENHTCSYTIQFISTTVQFGLAAGTKAHHHHLYENHICGYIMQFFSTTVQFELAVGTKMVQMLI